MMNQLNKSKNFILIPLLIISLVAFNFPSSLVLAEGEDSNDSQTEGVSDEGGGDEGTTGDQEGAEGDQGDSGDSNNEGSGDTNTEGDSEDPAGSEGEDESSGDAIIDTGDANSNIDLDNTVNSNILEEGEDETGDELQEEGTGGDEGDEGEESGDESEGTETDGEEGDGQDEGDTGGEGEMDNPEGDEGTGDETEDGDVENNETEEGETLGEDEGVGDEGNCTENCCSEINIVNDNEAEVENDVEGLASTGDNQAESNQGNAIINTGNVNIVFGLFNLVNTNLIFSDFSQFLFNIFESLQENINLSNELEPSSSTQGTCSPETEGCLNIVNENSGEIDNEVVIDGSSGGNTATSENGNAFIKTGNANVVANILNILNSNIIGSNWTQLIINVFDNWVGDLIFPGKEKMQELLNSSNQSGLCGGGCEASIFNSNEGQIENEVYVQADTGGNTASGNSAIIQTGNANAQTNLLNVANTNIIGGSQFLLAVNNFGNWKGQIFSLPPGLSIAGDFGGIKIYNLGSEEFNNPTGNSSLNVINDNTGLIKNSVVVNVSTGNNSASANNGQAIIETGNANVFTNLVNVLNSNLIGSNLLFGMINVFGSWQGNLAFGRPDLWLGESAVTSPNPAEAGGAITYTLTYTNNGDADATGVTIVDDFDEEYLSIVDSGNGLVSENPGDIQWDIGTVPTGGSGSVSYSVLIDSEIPCGITYLTNQATINSFEDDWNNEDNIDSISIAVYKPYPIGGAVLTSSPSLPQLEITKTNNNVNEFVYPGTEVDYTIELINRGDGSAFNVIVDDVLINDLPGIINSYSWDLGEVFPHEEITIDYTVAIGPEVPAGFYTNIAQATGFDSQGNQVNSPQASNTIEIRMPEAPPEEVSLEEIETELKEIESKIEKIREKIERLLPEGPAETFVSPLPEILVPEVLAQEEPGPVLEELEIEEEAIGEAEPEEGLEKFLAAIGSIFSLENLWWILILALVLLLIIFFLSRRRKIK